MSPSSYTDSFEHRVRKLGSRGAPQKPPRPKRRFVKELVIISGLIVVAVLLSFQADTPRPEYPEAQAAADRLNAVSGSVSRGDASLKAAAAAHDLRVYDFQFDGRTVSVVTQSEPTADGTCYGIRMGGGLSTLALKFAATDGCEPLGLWTFESTGRWEDVLPAERTTPWWFVPAMIALAGGVLWFATSIVLKLINR